jgi:6-phosphogluconolactonase
MRPEILQFEITEWPMQAARAVNDCITTILRDQGTCSVMLTGGQSAEYVYMLWHELGFFQQMIGVSFYFGDERCVPPNHQESNFGQAMRTLFKCGIPEDSTVFRMEADNTDHEAATARYGEMLPESIDVLLLGVGDDGHIASLFPGSAALYERNKKVVSITGPKPPHQRFTITPPVIADAKHVFVLAPGTAKAAVLCDAINEPNDFASLPARLVLNATWLLDTAWSKNVIQKQAGVLHA